MIEIACAADEAYIPHAAAMMRSALAHHAPAEIRFHLLHGPALPAASINSLRSMVGGAGGRIEFHVIDDTRVAGLPEMGRISRVMWYRIFLPELLPVSERVLYLDCDTLVMTDLQPLFELDLKRAALGAVVNVFEGAHADHAQRIGLDPGAPYFNSGVLLLNLGAWRHEGATAQLLERVRRTRLVWPDQDALNLTFAGRWIALHPRWNAQNSFFFFAHAHAMLGDALNEALAHPGIVHFEGGALAKPWHYLCRHPLRDEYFRYRRQTPFPVVDVEGRTLRNRLLRPLPMRWLLPTLQLLDRINRRLARMGT